MSHWRIFAFLFVAGAFALAGSGCGGLPSYGIARSAPHKDVVSLEIFLDSRASTEVYQKIAIEEAARALDEAGAREYPLYEVKVEFRGNSPERPKLADVLVFLSGDPATGAEVARAAPKIETIIY